MKIAIAGDFVPAFAGLDSVANEVKEFLCHADFRIINLECPLTNRGKPIAKIGPSLRADSSCVPGLTRLGVDVVTLANNHVNDYGAAGIADTLEVCKSESIRTVGAGMDICEASKPILLEKDGERIAILNFVHREFCVAGEGIAGANPFDLIHVLRSIDEARKIADGMVVIVHSGLEGVHYPSPHSVRKLRFIAEQQGVRAVVRHHSHAIQGAEVWKDVPIYYGLGNFYFPYGNPSASWRNGVILMVDVPSNRPALTSRMFVEFDDNGNLKGAAESKWCEKIFCDSSAAIADGDKLKAIWQGVVRRSSRFYLGSLYSSCDTIRRILVRLGVFGRMIPNRRQLLFLKNRISCETHTEVLEDVINQLMDDKGLR